MQKLREHHEKVDRLAAQKREKKKLQEERLAKDQLNDYLSDLQEPVANASLAGNMEPRTNG